MKPDAPDKAIIALTCDDVPCESHCHTAACSKVELPGRIKILAGATMDESITTKAIVQQMHDVAIIHLSKLRAIV